MGFSDASLYFRYFPGSEKKLVSYIYFIINALCIFSPFGFTFSDILGKILLLTTVRKGEKGRILRNPSKMLNRHSSHF
jgi:UPF0716 family protein affecting phage T7 exclusion